MNNFRFFLFIIMLVLTTTVYLTIPSKAVVAQQQGLQQSAQTVKKKLESS